MLAQFVLERGAYLCSPGPMFPGRDCVFRRRNPEKVLPQALGLDRQPVRQTRMLTPNPNPNCNRNRNRNPNPNHNGNPNIHDSSGFRLRKTHFLPGHIQSGEYRTRGT